MLYVELITFVDKSPPLGLHTSLVETGVSGCGKWKLGGKIMWKVEIRGPKFWKVEIVN